MVFQPVALLRLGWIASIFVTASGSAATTNSTISANSTVPIINVDDPVNGVLNATAWTLIYTYPLYIFGNFAGNVLKNVPVNTIYHQRELASPESPGVIKPNIDTLYSRVVLDLSKHDVVLTVPEISDGRYWNYPIYDPYGNDIAEIGNLRNYTAGKYLIRRADDVFTAPGVELPQSKGHNASQYKGIVNLPTTYGTMLIRLFVKENTTEDLNQLHIYQNASHLTPIPRNISLAGSPAGNISSLAPNGSLLGISTPEKLLDFAAKFTPYNQPENYTDRNRVAGILGAAGLYNGKYHAPSRLNLTEAAVIANASITADLAKPLHVRNLGNDWEVTIQSYQGNYGTHYAPRAYIAIAGYQQLTTTQTLYPGYKNVGFSSTADLAANTSLLFTFSGKPLLNPTGFWSLSIYGADQYLIPNELDRFEIGDRSDNLTYQDGSGLVYGDDADDSADGPFQVLLQSVDTPPPSNWTGNWVPASQSLSYIMRWYAPTAAMTNGTYVYPKVEVVESIV